MQKNLVIVESPAKAKTIEKFLGKDYKVMSSYGHIRDLKKREISIDEKTLEPEYEIPEEKVSLVEDLRSKAGKAETVWLASDEDREGEAISWHLCEVLGLDEQKTNRIVFHEITESAILDAIEHPRHINMDLVNAQQARRVLDRLVGFKLSPVLWRKVKPALSAGRVQSVAVRLIVEREREIQNFKSEPYYSVSGVFAVVNPDGSASEVKAQLSKRFSTEDEVMEFLEKCKTATFYADAITKKPSKRTPAPPFTTSTLQQEAARKLGFTVSQTMMVAQHLYESGRITYMRTDSVNLSQLCLNASKSEIVNLYGENYSKLRKYHTNSKGAQEAHEAIRPSYMNMTEIEGSAQERKLYDLIWKRTIASQMADAEIEKTTITIKSDGIEEVFTAQGEVIKFDGFLKVYRESSDDDENGEDYSHSLPVIKKGQELTRREILTTERFSAGPQRYTEASLVHKMEELGIGRPSTYAPTISTIQQREYVMKGDKKGEERFYSIYQLKGKQITQKTRKEMAGSERGKLLPTDIGTVVNDFLMENFPGIMDYNFTAKVEQDFDKIAEGDEKWKDMMKHFYKDFEPTVEETLNSRQKFKAGERELGNDPKTGRPVFVKIGRFGPVVQIGSSEDKDKPQFAQLPKELSMETITLEEAMELFKLPRDLGEFEGLPVSVGAGRFGPYVKHDRMFASLPKDADPMAITLDEAIVLIQEKRRQEAAKHMKFFLEDPKLEIMNGIYGPYLAYDGQNYRLPKNLHENAKDLTYDECMKIIEQMKSEEGDKKTAKRGARKGAGRKAATKKTTTKAEAEA
ncbi:DNA topoisomerase 1 [Xylanibacter ruminicola]|jgi:DNA topoisomerase-1|uniref:DNA topoisomerase 1 n=2 Tax=Xylanibacter ruminicola TaxID=839 RepID=D5EXD2_XYLR2|nr:MULTISPECIES: type I DNA topoisomerase [Prevotellaceae]MBP3246760.1 type I DNA topoisomerase [Prevotella sp.]ADE82762.1 DNA topoisomerase [Xylanibacter ruminicola 23]QVJ79639.1 type I DNA topoisomerase [Xylanibacter ruminicola]SDQ35303.1 DNA topoisomerase-1 [Prevotella sp. khp1]SEA01698.1 DNA topoisomerase-1 [Xylanibacter ruminicola]